MVELRGHVSNLYQLAITFCWWPWQREARSFPLIAACWRTEGLAPSVRQHACWHCRGTTLRGPHGAGWNHECVCPGDRGDNTGADARVILDAHLDVRMTRTELAAIKRRARVLGVKASTRVRAVLRDALDARRHEEEALAAQVAVPRPSPELAGAVEQVRRVGVNLNQVVRAGTAMNEEVLRDLLAAVVEVRALLGDEVSL